LTHDKSNHEKLLQETKKKIKQLHQQLTKSHTQEELVLKELEMVKEVVEVEKKEGLKHRQEIITKVDVEINLRIGKSKYLEMSNSTCMKS
jgi:hypothetical protein